MALYLSDNFEVTLFGRLIRVSIVLLFAEYPYQEMPWTVRVFAEIRSVMNKLASLLKHEKFYIDEMEEEMYKLTERLRKLSAMLGKPDLDMIFNDLAMLKMELETMATPDAIQQNRV